MKVEFLIRSMLLSVLAMVALTPPALGFDVDEDDPVHQHITRSAIIEVNRSLNLSMDSAAINDIVAGNVHTDDLPQHHGVHKTGRDQADLHFNNGHVLSADGRQQFDSSFLSVRNFIDRAAQLSQNNPRVLSPKYPTITQIRNRVIGLCTEEAYKDDCRITYIPIRRLNYSHDPHIRKAKRLLDLREELKPLLRAMRASNDNRQARVRNIILEINAYEARQLLGHAFHTQQDFFSHSNFLELANGKAGPPCAPRFGSDERCGTPVAGLPQRFGDPVLTPLFAIMADGFRFNLAAMSEAVADNRLQPLQTGWVRLGFSPINLRDNVHLFCRTNSVPSEFDYCHWRGNQHPELNKDKPGNEDESHRNHAYAKATAQFVSEMMWLSYLRQAELPDRNIKPQLRWQPHNLRERTVNANRQSGSHQILLPVQHLSLTIPNALALDSKFSYSIENSSAANAAQGGRRCRNGVDFVQSEGRGVFRRGATRSMIPITLCPDSEVEIGGESFLVKIQSSSLEETSRVIYFRDDDNHPTPTLSGLGTVSKLVTSGTQILVSGQDFRPVSRIEFNGRQITSRYENTKLLSFSVPTRTQPGTYDIAVTTEAGGRSEVKKLRVVGPLKPNKPDLSPTLQNPKFQKPKLDRQPRQLPPGSKSLSEGRKSAESPVPGRPHR